MIWFAESKAPHANRRSPRLQDVGLIADLGSSGLTRVLVEACAKNEISVN